MSRVRLGVPVFEAALERLREVYAASGRVTVSFSAGKDSTCCLELALLAAEAEGRLPVDVVMRDDEVMFPGTFEYADRVARREDVRMHWLVAGQPVVNLCDRALPYFWCFDDRLDPLQWAREPPGWSAQGEGAGPLPAGGWEALREGTDRDYPVDGWTEGSRVVLITDQNIEHMVGPGRFPVPDGGTLHTVIGLRVQESRGRLYGLYSSGGFLTKPNRLGVRNVRPVYDWTDSDVWKAVADRGWDYNRCYDQLHRAGLPRHKLRVAPPTMNQGGMRSLQIAARLWPRWFDTVAHRLRGVRAVANYGERAVNAERRAGESWEECFRRECVERAPDWIAERAEEIRRRITATHAKHSNQPTLPDSEPCWQCTGELGSWRNLTRFLYSGDPFAVKATNLKALEPEFFREGAGAWGGAPAFA